MRTTAKGNTLSEYGLVLGLLALLSVGSLVLLGGNTSKLLGGFGKQSGNISKLNGLITPTPQTAMTASGNAAGLPSLTGGGYLKISLNSEGVPVVGKTSSAGSVTNATSIDGSQWNSTGTFKMADNLQAMIDAEKDPTIRKYLQDMADLTYLLGASEGDIDGVAALDVAALKNIDALKEVAADKQKLLAMIQNPPAGIDSAKLQEALPMAVDAFNIANSYTNKLSYYLQNNLDFQVASVLNCGQACATSGDALTQSISAAPDSLPTGTNYTDYVSLNQLKATAQTVLADSGVTNTAVKSTLTTAVTVDSTAK